MKTSVQMFVISTLDNEYAYQSWWGSSYSFTPVSMDDLFIQAQLIYLVHNKSDDENFANVYNILESICPEFFKSYEYAKKILDIIREREYNDGNFRPFKIVKISFEVEGEIESTVLYDDENLHLLKKFEADFMSLSDDNEPIDPVHRNEDSTGYNVPYLQAAFTYWKRSQ